MNSIGGYFGLECANFPLYHKDGIYLNSCRNGLRYLIRSLGIKRIFIPSFTCHVVQEAIEKEGCRAVKYNLGEDLLPERELPREEYIVCNNYFGVTGENVEKMTRQYPNLIVDNAQAFFVTPKGRFSIYSPRKFFGLPDGGILIAKEIPQLSLERGVSYDVCSHLLKRIDLGAEAGYSDFRLDSEKIIDYPVQKMSRLTKALMGNCNYEEAKRKRIENFNFLKAHLSTGFPISMKEDDVPLVYPYLASNGYEIRERLITNKIFCARYWPNVLEDNEASPFEKYLTKNLVAIPVDQRYGIQDMQRIIDIISN